MNEEGLPDGADRAPHPVFISYATADRTEALKVCKAIELRGTPCWVSMRDVPAGANYQEAIVQSLRTARAVVLVFSELANTSDEIKKELSLASRYNVPVIALRLKDVEPSDAFAYELSTRQWINAFEGWDRSIDTLVGRIAQISASAPVAPAVATPTSRRPPLSWARGMEIAAAGSRLRQWVAFAIAAASLAAAVLFFNRDASTQRDANSAPPATEVSLAVLPFTDLSAARDQEYLCEGMADEIINHLIQIPALRLVGLRSTLLFKGKSEDLRVIGEKLGVDNLLDGTIRKDGDRLRIAAQLLRARDGTPIWSNVYEREQRDLFKVQEEIARDVAQALSVKLDVGPMNRAQGGTTNLDAYYRYLKWRQSFLTQRYATADVRQRVELLREAVQFDPRFVLAWSALANELEQLAAYLEKMAQQPGGSESAMLRNEAVKARARVQELAPESWMALRIRSEQLANEGRLAESIEVARRILDSGPFTLDRAYPYIGMISTVGYLDEAIELMQRVIKTEPLMMGPSTGQQYNLTAARRYPEAEAEYERSLKLEGGLYGPELAAFTRALGLYTDRAAVHARHQRMVPHLAAFPGGDSQFFRDLEPVLDDRATMRAMVRKRIEERQPGYEEDFIVADPLGESEAALTALRAFLNRPDQTDFRKYWVVWTLPHSRLRTLPGFKAMLREAGIADYWRKTGKWGDACKPLGDDDFECH